MVVMMVFLRLLFFTGVAMSVTCNTLCARGFRESDVLAYL